MEISTGVELKSIQHACAKGENFASIIYRVVLDSHDGEPKSLIVKSRPIGNGVYEDYVKKFNVFPKEIEMYEHVERFEKLFHSVGHQITFAPK